MASLWRKTHGWTQAKKFCNCLPNGNLKSTKLRFKDRRGTTYWALVFRSLKEDGPSWCRHLSVLQTGNWESRAHPLRVYDRYFYNAKYNTNLELEMKTVISEKKKKRKTKRQSNERKIISTIQKRYRIL